MKATIIFFKKAITLLLFVGIGLLIFLFLRELRKDLYEEIETLIMIAFLVISIYLPWRIWAYFETKTRKKIGDNSIYIT